MPHYSPKVRCIKLVALEMMEKPFFVELRSSSDFTESCIDGLLPGITRSLTVSLDSTVLIVDTSSANFSLTFSCVDETSEETPEARFVLFFA